MTSDRVLTLIAIIWFLLALLYLAGAGIIHAAPIPGGDDSAMVCGVWTYYAAGVAERAQRSTACRRAPAAPAWLSPLTRPCWAGGSRSATPASGSAPSRLSTSAPGTTDLTWSAKSII